MFDSSMAQALLSLSLPFSFNRKIAVQKRLGLSRKSLRYSLMPLSRPLKRPLRPVKISSSPVSENSVLKTSVPAETGIREIQAP